MSQTEEEIVAPIPARSFEELGVSEAVVSTLAKRGVDAPFPIQALVMEDALEGLDVLAKSRTGSGKTLAFAVPIVEQIEASAAKPAALVLVPTRELAEQVRAEFDDIAKAKGLKVTAAYGGVSLSAQADRVPKSHILIATPGRLQDLADRRMINLSKVSIFVLDEADRMLDMGFQPQVDGIVDMLPDDRQTMFFSATLDGHVGFLAKRYTHDPVEHSIESPRETVEEAHHIFVKVEQAQKVDKLIEMLAEGDRGLALVFARTKRGVDRLAYRLKQRGLNAVPMHGDLTQGARQQALNRFEAGHVDVLVATDVAARGLDLDDITHVVNYDPPEDDKAFVHRVGRTARAGRSGTSITFVTPKEQHDVSRMAARLRLIAEFEKSGMQIAEARVVFSSHGRRSSLRPPRKRNL